MAAAAGFLNIKKAESIKKIDKFRSGDLKGRLIESFH